MGQIKALFLQFEMSNTKNVKIQVNALIHRLQINKALKFQARVQWKRHKNKVETRLVNHEHGYSIFEEALNLDFNLTYNQSKGIYEEKNTEIVVIILYEGKVKSGGYAKYNISQILNNNLDGKMVSIPLTECPDPQAKIEITFTFDHSEEDISDVPSVLNTSSRDFNMSRIDFHDDKMSLQMDRINSTINKIEELAKSVKEKGKNTQEKIPQLTRKVQELQGQKSTLLSSITKLQQQLKQRDKINNDEKSKNQKIISDLEKQLDKRSKEMKSREFIEIDEQKKYKQDLLKKEKQLQKYKRLYEETANQLEQTKTKQLRGSLGFGKMQVEDVHQIARFEAEKQELLDKAKELQILKSENNELQIKVATDSFRIAQLFNAAYEIGGGKLLDQLQKAIGLIES